MKRIVPPLTRDFPTQVCVHTHEMPIPPQNQRLPLFVLVSRENRVVIIEGMPEYESLKSLLRDVLSLPGELNAPGR